MYTTDGNMEREMDIQAGVGLVMLMLYQSVAARRELSRKDKAFYLQVNLHSNHHRCTWALSSDTWIQIAKMSVNLQSILQMSGGSLL